MLSLAKTNFETLVESLTIQNNGDSVEKTNYNKLDFPQYELFWKKYVAPMTKRIEVPQTDASYIRPRQNIDKQIEKISRLHYAVFVRLLQAEFLKNISNQIPFEEFYIKIGSVCDLIDELILEIYFLECKIKNVEPTVVSSLKKEEFIEICNNFYDNDYPKLYENYLKKGKFIPVKLPHITSITKVFFENNSKNQLWQDWNELSISIRKYRNFFIHNTLVIRLQYTQGLKLPSRDKITQLADYRNIEQLNSAEFVDIKIEMNNDFKELLTKTKELWNLFLEILEPYRFNQEFLKLYDLEVTHND